MTGKTILITGAASGIGLALAEFIATKNTRVILSDINQDALDSIASELSDKGISVSTLKLDVSSFDDIANAGNYIREQGGQVDALINNAGIQYVSKLEEFPPEQWQRIIDILLVGPAMLTRELLPLMRANNFGRIINIGSIHSLVASPYKSAYVAAKHGILGFSKTIALETADCDVTVNTICPSYVKTPLVEKQIADQAKENGISEEEVIDKIMLEPMPKKSFIDMDEIAGAVSYLLSDAARNFTGQELVLDGGWTAR